MGTSTSVIPTYGTDFSAITPPKDGFVKIDDKNVSSTTVNANRAPFHFDNMAIWSVRNFSGDIPCPRMGHASVYCPEEDSVYVAYGYDTSKRQLNDFLKLDLKTNHWENFEIVGEKPCPRAGTKAVLVGRNIVFFGGYANKHHLDDLHVLNIDTHEIVFPKTTGEPPQPCSGFTMFAIDNQVILFGGYNGSPLNQLSILDLQSLEWKTVNTVHQRTAPGFCSFQDYGFVFGGSKVQGIIQIHPNNEGEDILSILPNGGPSIPPCDISQPSFVFCDNMYLLLFGGDRKTPCPNEENSSKYTPIYIFNLSRNRWSIFHIIPDSVTVNFSDGYIDKNGEFLLPNSKDSSIFYRSYEREVVALLGYPHYSPPCLFVFSCGESFAIYNQQNDMLDMLVF